MKYFGNRLQRRLLLMSVLAVCMIALLSSVCLADKSQYDERDTVSSNAYWDSNSGDGFDVANVDSDYTVSQARSYYGNDEYYTARELDEMLAPIALYPDPLLAQIFPAATYPDDLEDAAYVTDYRVDDYLIDSQDWDVSVKSVAHYPSVLRMMVEKPDWTVAIGQAYAYQPTAVMDSVQRLRA
ncbi:MAG TPA: DUF3300 domain-containing protein, partial [Armatimonadota bacterium]